MREERVLCESPFAVRHDEEAGEPVLVLEDRAARSEVWIAPRLGCNAYRFCVEHRGQITAILYSPGALTGLYQDPLGYGLPILFPFTGQIPDGKLSYGGQEYRVAGRADHGFVYDRPWQVIQWGAGAGEGAWVAACIDSCEFLVLGPQYPSSFRFAMTYRLRGWSLAIEARAQNTGLDPLPVGFGLHPYLRAPIGDDSSVDGCAFTVPVTHRWELAGLVPTGQLVSVGRDQVDGIPLQGRALDEVYTGVRLNDGSSRATLTDTHAGLAVDVEADAQFSEWVVYTPPLPAICLEPWTCPPNAINLEEQGVRTGLTALAPGEERSWTARLDVREV